ncbi:MAG: carbohydrate binding domain-containing protein [Phycisphaerae bacterium]|nr:carbohydrate binding domain-containing protein [Phycisphaerae bacterium]
MSKKLFFFISFVLVFVLSGSISQAQENQFNNSEFDDGLTSWGSYGSAGFTREVVQSGALSGNNAVLLDVTDASAASSIGIFQTIPRLVQGQTYPFGFIAKSDQEREMVVLIQLYKPEVPSYNDIFLTQVQLTTDPQKYVLEYTHDDEGTAENPGWSVNMYLMLKGTYWGMAGSDLNTKVWIDRVYFGAEPPFQERGQAVGPTPADGALHEDTWVNLDWLAGEFAVSHDLYLGESFDDVNDGLGDTFRGNKPAGNVVVGFPGFPYPDGLVPGTTYYWRIDEVNDADPNSPWKGEVWSFTVPPIIAYAPNPPDGDRFADPDVVLGWMPGFNGKLHTVHFGDNFDDVNNAVAGIPQSPMTHTPGTLEREKTYYWRVDEFDGATTHTGNVWSFTVAREGGGLKAEYFDNRNLAGEPILTRVDPQIDFDWGNGDVPGENSPDTTIPVDEFSARWSGELEVDITDAYTFTIGANNGFRLFLDGELIIDYWDGAGTGRSDPIELVAGTSHSVRMEYYESVAGANAQLSWAGSVRDEQVIPQAALSLPVKANTPSPANGSTGASMTAILTWSPGDSAASHEVYFGTNADAVKNATTSSPEYVGARTLGSESYGPGKLAWDTTYYWRVDELDSAAPDGRWVGNLWSFTAADFILVDDLESYNDVDPPDPASNRIFDKWIDGFGTTTNGAIVGNDLPPYAEQTIVHGGAQSMGYQYNNNLMTSEATLTLVYPRDWTEESVARLSLWFTGDPANAAERMFVAAGGNAVVYHQDPAVTQIAEWAEWVIDLQTFADQGLDLANVNTITIGFGTKNSPAAGGSGQMYFDDIRLYR